MAHSIHYLEYAEHEQVYLQSIVPPQNDIFYAEIHQHLFEGHRVSPEVLFKELNSHHFCLP
jgi:hypothetical protein